MKRSNNPWRSLSLVLVGVLASVVVQQALAATSGMQGKSVVAVRVKRSTDLWYAGSSPAGAYQDLPDAVVTMRVPAGEEAFLLTRFSASSGCSGGSGEAFCCVRILVNGVPAKPSDYATFDSNDTGTASGSDIEAHAIERSTGRLGPGTYTVKVQVRTDQTAMIFYLKDWHFAVERVRI